MTAAVKWSYDAVPRRFLPRRNPAERAQRAAVIARKLSFGAQREQGSRSVERILTICEICRQHGRGIGQCLAAVKSWIGRRPAPRRLLAL